MKKYLFLAVTAIVFNCFGQSDDFNEFRRAKKSVALKTGINMKYFETGNPSGEVVILLHGFTDTGRSFKLMMESMTAMNSNLRIIAPDMRGHGESSMPDAMTCAANPSKCFTVAAFASDIVDLMRHLSISEANVVGHSLGSFVAQEIALKHPKRVKKLILIGSAADGKAARALTTSFFRPFFFEPWKELLTAKNSSFVWPRDAYSVTPNDLGPDGCIATKQYWVAELGAPQDYLTDIYNETIETRMGVWAGVVRALADFDNTEALAGLHSPTLVLWATQDVFFQSEQQQTLKASLTKAYQHHKTPIFHKTYGKKPLSEETGNQDSDLGHNLQWSAPKQVAMDVIQFIVNGSPLNNRPYFNDAGELVVDAGGEVWVAGR